MAGTDRFAPAVWLVDEDSSASAAAERLLREAALEVRTLRSADELLFELRRREPDCLILELRLDGGKTFEFLPEVVGRSPWIPIIFLSAGADITSCVRAMRNGAVDVLEKPAQTGPLLEAIIRALARGRAWREARLEREDATRRLATLTLRERHVFDLVVLGLPNKSIAAELGISEKTVKVHRGRAMQKLDASSIVDLVRLADRVGPCDALPRAQTQPTTRGAAFEKTKRNAEAPPPSPAMGLQGERYPDARLESR